MTVTRADAERDLIRRVNTEFMPAARGAIGAQQFDQLAPEQQAVLTSLTYNYGTGAWEKGLAGVALAIRSGGDVAGAIRALGEHNQGVNRKRRWAEADVWARQKMRATFDPNASADVPDFSGYITSRGYTGSGQVSAGDGFRLDVDYEVVDASLLTRASGPYQPRDRGRIGSDAWVADTAARLDPAQLMPSPTADRGAPLVGPDGMIESGNGRFSAITRAYERHPDRAAAYRQQIEVAGFDIPEGVERPVLIARRRTELTDAERAALTVDAQDSGVARMTPTELARTGSQAMTAERLAGFMPGARITDADNQGFVRQILSALPRSERNALLDGAGALNAEGARRIRQAFFARAGDDPDLIARYAEAEDAGDLKSLMDALENAAPEWATLRAEIEAGAIAPDFDITGHVLEAMRLIGQARSEAAAGRGHMARILSDMLDDIDLLDGALSPLTVRLVQKFWRNGRAAPAAEVTDFLTRYARDARKAGGTADLLAVRPAEVLRKIDADTFGDLPQEFGRVRGQTDPQPVSDSALPQAAYAKGADSPEAIDADGELSQTLDSGPFGPVFRDIQDDPEAAIARLLERQEGEVPAAFRHPDDRIGDVALIYGNDRMGLRHIATKHPEMIAEIPRLLREGRVVPHSTVTDRIYLTDDAVPPSVMAIRLDWEGDRKSWVVTSFVDDQGQVARHLRTTNGPDANASPRIPDATGQVKDKPPAAEIQGDAAGEDIGAALREARGEFDDMRWRVDPNGPEISARDLLDDIEADVELAEVVRLCGIGAPT